MIPAEHSPDELSPEERLACFQKTLDGRVLEPLVAAFMPSALAAAKRMLPPSAAEDAVQEAFLRVIRFCDRYDPAQPFAGWFYTILRNVCTDLKRQHLRQLAVIREYPLPSQPEPRPAADPSADSLPLLKALPPEERDVLVLRIAADLPFADIAVVLGISLEAAKKRAQRGLKRLRERAEQNGVATGPDVILSPPPTRERK